MIDDDDDDIMMAESFLYLYGHQWTTEKDPVKRHELEQMVYETENKVNFLKLKKLLDARERETHPSFMLAHDTDIRRLQTTIVKTSKDIEHDGRAQILVGGKAIPVYDPAVPVLKRLLALDIKWREEMVMKSVPDSELCAFDKEIIQLQKTLMLKSRKNLDDPKGDGVVFGEEIVQSPNGWDAKTINGLLAVNAARRGLQTKNRYHQNILWLREQYTPFIDVKQTYYYGA